MAREFSEFCGHVSWMIFKVTSNIFLNKDCFPKNSHYMYFLKSNIMCFHHYVYGIYNVDSKFLLFWRLHMKAKLSTISSFANSHNCEVLYMF